MGIRSVGAKNKGYMKNMSTGKVMTFLLNPSTYSETRSVTFNEVDGVGGGYPLIEYSKGGSRTVSFDIYLVGTAEEVRICCKFIRDLCPPKNKNVSFAPPAKVMFALGNFSVTGVLTGYTIKNTDFDENVKPIEASVSIKLLEVV